MKDQVELRILGQGLIVKCPDGEGPIREAASLIEERIEEVKGAGTADSLRIMLYVAFKLAGENLDLKKQLNGLEVEIDSMNAGLMEII